MASSPCGVWSITHLMNRLLKLHKSYFLFSYSTICSMAQPEPWGKPCQSHLPAHAMGCRYEEEETRRSAQGPSETPHCSDPGSRNMLCSHTWFRLTRCLQRGSSSGVLVYQCQQSNQLWKHWVKPAPWGRTEQHCYLHWLSAVRGWRMCHGPSAHCSLLTKKCLGCLTDQLGILYDPLYRCCWTCSVPKTHGLVSTGKHFNCRSSENFVKLPVDAASIADVIT